MNCHPNHNICIIVPQSIFLAEDDGFGGDMVKNIEKVLKNNSETLSQKKGLPTPDLVWVPTTDFRSHFEKCTQIFGCEHFGGIFC